MYSLKNLSRSQAPHPTHPGSHLLSAAGNVSASRPAVPGPAAATSHCLDPVATQTLPKGQVPHTHEPRPTAVAPTPRVPRAELLGTPALLRTGPSRSLQGRGTQSSFHKTPVLDVCPTEPPKQSRSFQCSDIETLSDNPVTHRTHRTRSSLSGTTRP